MRNDKDRFVCFQTTRLSRAESGGISVCDRDQSRVEDRSPSRNSKSKLRIPAKQQRHLRNAQFFSLATLTPRNIISRARTKQHLFKKKRGSSSPTASRARTARAACTPHARWTRATATCWTRRRRQRRRRTPAGISSIDTSSPQHAGAVRVDGAR